MDIKTIILGGLSSNCYLLRFDSRYILIDTGSVSKRTKLVKALESEGCNSINLKLIILTHGDFDHTGNADYLRNKFNSKIIMHSDDSGIVEHGDMFFNRKEYNILTKKIVNALFRITKFKPDFTVDVGYDLFEYGLNAKVLHLPGHTKGSIGILTSEGDLICGDLLTNTYKPALNHIIDDSIEAKACIEKLKTFSINTVYPGHGRSFTMGALSIK